MFKDREGLQWVDPSRDAALPLTDDGASTISAMHAYVAAFDALELAEGDALVELGGGTGYGAALAWIFAAVVITLTLVQFRL